MRPCVWLLAAFRKVDGLTPPRVIAEGFLFSIKIDKGAIHVLA
jgi:hypothetical protein